RMSASLSTPTGSRSTSSTPSQRLWVVNNDQARATPHPGNTPAQYDETPKYFQGDSLVPGKIELMMGPMRSNKTAELLRRAEMRRQYAKQYVLLIKPSDDTKGGPGLVESRNPNGHARMQALEFNSADPWPILEKIDEVEQQIGKRVECIA